MASSLKLLNKQIMGTVFPIAGVRGKDKRLKCLSVVIAAMCASNFKCFPP